jgi:hypothetical protein
MLSYVTTFVKPQLSGMATQAWFWLERGILSLSSTEACSRGIFPGRGLGFRRFAFLFLAVMTQSYAFYRHDDVFRQEHIQ